MCNRCRNTRCHGELVKRNKVNTILIAGLNIMGKLQSQTRFANTPDPQQGQQATIGLGLYLEHLVHFALSADKWEKRWAFIFRGSTLTFVLIKPASEGEATTG